MAIIIKQQISNHPIFTDVERFVTITRIANNADVKQIILNGHIEYINDGVDVTSNFRSQIDNWIVGNHYSVQVRDENNEPILDENGEELTMPAFDYFHSLILANQVPLLSLLQVYILNDDEKGAFNF
ncbi:hypothetical protein [Weeksella virosa]|uniref:Uncharacterized protein n=1 Tax=Weeksella virosa (strain ATCC 43766 / DSM 16922 / JCM 21250 / CCUG 30538 / CDC 9751 / IAM 14551 / NBRC 16016 / NCTC 11634 / CL345/78) TaxID=865938 RepID=F0P2T4_WEEVC|nr:hypothetical protein [Weeksella virosa]ADX66824.1 hypothetical protein Weevi_0098 [Weeksella virosa DSM 16922]VEH63452.1 Uncharacterised protein [Weeksella virosa]